VTPNGKSTTLETSKVVRNQSKTISRVTITTTSTSIIDINTIKSDVKTIQAQYEEKGFFLLVMTSVLAGV
jgi:hypothetical protein